LGFKGVLFDLDGTLVDFHFPIKPSRLAMIDYLSAKGFDCGQMSDADRTQDIIDKAETQVNLGKVNVDFQTIKLDISRLLDKFEFEAFSRAKVKPHAIELLQYLRKTRHRIALITNGGRDPTEKVLVERGLKTFFDIIVTRDDVNKLKPSGEGLKKALSALSLEPQLAIFVGDSIIDVLAARDACIKVAVIPQGSTTVEKLRLAKPDYLLGSLQDCYNIL
jgi:HAD superfamily hydrolase (TIGR01549 family)